jgi:hypothetical protein
MRILYNNKLAIADTIEATTEDYNFPLGNLLVNQLAMAYRATDITTDITVTFVTAQAINSVGIAGHNGHTVVIEYFTLSTDVVPVYTKTYENVLDTDMFYSSEHTIEKLIIRFESSEVVEVGSLFIGDYLQMPNPNAYYPENFVMTNERSAQKFGAVYGSDGELLRQLSPSFSYADNATYKAVISMVNAVRNYKTLFVDMTEDNHAYKEPVYGTLETTTFSTSRATHMNTSTQSRHSFSLTILEVK